jgi:hypothetical protein
MQLDTLNTFCDRPSAKFVAGKGGLLNAEISNAHASASISLYAGQVLSWQPKGVQHEVLFLSKQAWYQPGKAIKGGVPICWPWFGPDPQGKGRPAHGFARTSEWEVLKTASPGNGATQLVLGLKLNESTRSLGGDIRRNLTSWLAKLSGWHRLPSTATGHRVEPGAARILRLVILQNLGARLEEPPISTSGWRQTKVQSGDVTVGAVERICIMKNDLQIRRLSLECPSMPGKKWLCESHDIAASMADRGEDYRYSCVCGDRQCRIRCSQTGCRCREVWLLNMPSRCAASCPCPECLYLIPIPSAGPAMYFRLFLLTLSLCVAGCASYRTPGAGVPVGTLAKSGDDIAGVMNRQPAAEFPARIALARVQAADYGSANNGCYGAGRYCVVTVRDIESEDDIRRLQQLPMVAGVAGMTRVLLPDRLDTIHDLALGRRISRLTCCCCIRSARASISTVPILIRCR